MPFKYRFTKTPQQAGQDWPSAAAYQIDGPAGANKDVLVDLHKIVQKVKTEVSRFFSCSCSDITYYASVTNDAGVTVRRTQHIRRVQNNGKKHKLQIRAAREWAREQDLRCRNRGSRGTKKVVGWFAVGQEDIGTERTGPDDRDQRMIEIETQARTAREREMRQRTESVRQREREAESMSRRGLDLEREVREQRCRVVRAREWRGRSSEIRGSACTRASHRFKDFQGRGICPLL